MDPSLRAPRLLAGVTLSSAPQPGLKKQHVVSVHARHGSCADETSFWIEEPMRFHRARYEHLTHSLHGRINLASALLTCIILLLMGLRASWGDHISAERWLCGLLSGWFIIFMTRLALFTCLAAPRGISYAQGRLRISGLGILNAGQILHWSVQRGVRINARAKPGARLQICCRWCGCERHWTMLMEEGPESEKLERLLEMYVPTSPHAAVPPPLHRTIQIEAGVLSQ